MRTYDTSPMRPPVRKELSFAVAAVVGVLVGAMIAGAIMFVQQTPVSGDRAPAVERMERTPAYGIIGR